MRYAFVSDIHANLQAWNAVIDHIHEQNITQIINLGDVVGYGPSPKEVLDSVRKHSQISVIGNHDAVCGGRMDTSFFNKHAHAVIKWTQQQLDDEDVQFFSDMPAEARPTGASFLVTHAEVVDPLKFSYIITEENAEKNFAACEDQLIFIGHTHQPGIFVLDQYGDITIDNPISVTLDSDKRYIINPGSVGDPRSSDIVASYCTYDSETRCLTYHRVAFDTDAYRLTLKASGLEEEPYFIRYLDAVNAHTQSPPHIRSLNTEIAGKPKIDLMPERPEPPTQKKGKAGITITLLLSSLFIGIATWITMSHLSKNDTATIDPAKQPISTEEKQPTPASLPVIKKQVPSPKRIVNIPPTTNFPVARYIRIVGRSQYPLHFAEVEVYSNKSNIALAKKATQSSTQYKASFASRAVDGVTKGSVGAKLAYTRVESPKQPWWEVDLGKDHRIEAIIVYNRQASRKLRGRLNGSYIILRNEAGDTVYRMPQTVIPSSGLIKAPMRKK